MTEPPPPDAPRDVALDVYRRTQRVMGSVALARMLLAVPRTLRFVADNLEKRLSGVEGHEPLPRLSLSLAAHVAVDEAILQLAMGPNRYPRRKDYERVGGELRAARALFEERGWLAEPRSYHRTPPPLDDVPATRERTVRAARMPVLSYERLVWQSEFAPRPEEPGYERWGTYQPNRTAGAWLLRQDDPSRPWLVCVHGFGMGFPVMDFNAFEGRALADEMGLNLALPVLPLHGHRKVTRWSGEAFLSFDLVNTLHGLTQSIWDLRRLVGWIRQRSSAPIGVYGVSLGAYVAALLAGLEPEVHMVIAGIPVADFPELFRSHSPHHIRLRAVAHDILGGPAEDVHRVVSPLSYPALPPRERRFVFGGLADRVVRPEQASRLATHWERPELCWYPGNHVAYLWAPEVRAFIRSALRRGLLGEERGP